MLARAMICQKDACNAFNAKNYSAALQLFREARGYARNTLPKNPDHTTPRIYTLLAEATINIADCKLMLATENQSGALNLSPEFLKQLTEVKEEIIEAQEHLVSAKTTIKHARPSDQNEVKRLNDLIAMTIANVKRRLDKAKIIIYWNNGIERIKDINKRLKETRQADAALKNDISTALNIELDDAITIFQKALELAKSYPEDNSAAEIREAIVELYEDKGDLFSLLEENERFTTAKREYLDFMLVQYSNAFHVLLESGEPAKHEFMPLYLSVLNVLESKANLLARQEYLSQPEKEKRMHACVEIIKFMKKFPVTKYEAELTVREKLEIQSYVFNAHYLLSKYYLLEKPLSTEVSKIEKYKTEKAKRKDAHAERAMQEAKTFFQLSKDVVFEEDEVLFRDNSRIREYFTNHTFKNALLQMTEHAEFSGKVLALVTALIGVVHRGGRAKVLHQCLSPIQMSGKQSGLCADMAMDFMLEALKICSDIRLRNYLFENIKLLFTEHEKHFWYVAKNNPHIIFSVSANKTVAANLNPGTAGANGAKALMPKEHLYLLVKEHFAQVPAALPKTESRNQLLKMYSDYIINLNAIFNTEASRSIIKGVLREISKFLSEHRYSNSLTDICAQHAAEIEQIMPTPKVLHTQDKQVVDKEIDSEHVVPVQEKKGTDVRPKKVGFDLDPIEDPRAKRRAFI